jgi:hypothetical protein
VQNYRYLKRQLFYTALNIEGHRGENNARNPHHSTFLPCVHLQANQWQLLKAIGVLEDDKTTIGKKGRRAQKVSAM